VYNRRIRRPKEQEDMYRELTDSNEFGFFSTYKDVFMAAGLIGFINQKRVPFKGSLEGIHWNIFNQDTDEAVINAVALADSGEVSVINTDEDTFEKKVLIFEEYAAAGVEILHKMLMESPKLALDTYFAYLMSMEEHLSTKERNLKAIADLIDFD
jgi:dnd system-associated protein 4